MNKKLLSILILVILLCFSFVTVSAHPGRTDSQGGHHNRSNGSYHYHHGQPAHQHPNGICPYDNENNSDTLSDANNVSTQNHQSTFSKVCEIIGYVIIGISCGGWFILLIVYSLVWWVVESIKEAVNKRKNNTK